MHYAHGHVVKGGGCLGSGAASSSVSDVGCTTVDIYDNNVSDGSSADVLDNALGWLSCNNNGECSMLGPVRRVSLSVGRILEGRHVGRTAALIPCLGWHTLL